MYYLFGILCVCALGVVPLSASAQAGEAHTAPEPNLEKDPTEVGEKPKMSQDAANHLTDKRLSHPSPPNPAHANP